MPSTKPGFIDNLTRLGRAFGTVAAFGAALGTGSNAKASFEHHKRFHAAIEKMREALGKPYSDPAFYFALNIMRDEQGKGRTPKNWQEFITHGRKSRQIAFTKYENTQREKMAEVDAAFFALATAYEANDPGIRSLLDRTTWKTARILMQTPLALINDTHNGARDTWLAYLTGKTAKVPSLSF